uniref:Uncharacterized protein n=1 Tax=Solanum lycopersicum TaxID=4081 RepID=A0A3Q7EDR1_SOLLC
MQKLPAKACVRVVVLVEGRRRREGEEWQVEEESFIFKSLFEGAAMAVFCLLLDGLVLVSIGLRFVASAMTVGAD